MMRNLQVSGNGGIEGGEWSDAVVGVRGSWQPLDDWINFRRGCLM